MNARVLHQGDFVVRAVEAPDLWRRIEECREAVEAFWSQAQAESGGRLFNGKLLHFLEARQANGVNEIRGVFVEYKVYLASRSNPELDLDVRPMGISGALVVEGGWAVLARRASTVTHYPGQLELVPSGGIDASCLQADGVVDHRAMLLDELREEVGLEAGSEVRISDLALIEDTLESVLDICMLVEHPISREEVLTSFHVSTEYSNIEFVKVEELAGRLTKSHDVFVPTSQAIAEMLPEAMGRTQKTSLEVSL
jgi:hypothetical protein